jgi:glycosyltransferase involved in cell wall biosynthesis
MRICFVVHQATKEGAGRFMLDQVDHLLGKGIAVCVIAPQNGPLCDALADRRVDVQLIDNEWWTRTPSRPPEPDFAAAVSAARRMAAQFRDWSVDIAYTQTIVAPVGSLAAALAGIPHVWHIHEFSYNPGAIQMAIPKASLARMIELTSNAVFFNSKAVAAEWAGLIPVEKTRLVYNWTLPVEDETPDATDEHGLGNLRKDNVFVAVIVGSVLPWKRQRDAVDAVMNLLRDGLDVALLVVGPHIDVAYASEIREAIQRDGFEDRIRLVGYKEHPQQFMRSADVTLVCSDREPFGRVTVESMAQGTPVIGADSGGTPEIIDDGINGLLFPTGDVMALTDRLRKLIQDDALRSRLASAAKAKSKRFQDPDATMAPVIELLTSLVGQANPSWPLGTMIGAGLANSGGVTPGRFGPRGAGRRFLRSLLRRGNHH